VGMARHCGPGSWIPRNSGSPLVRCPIARAVAGAGLRFVTLIQRILQKSLMRLAYLMSSISRKKYVFIWRMKDISKLIVLFPFRSIALSDVRQQLNLESYLMPLKLKTSQSVKMSARSSDIICGRLPSYTLHCTTLTLIMTLTLWAEHWLTGCSWPAERSRQCWVFYAFLFSSYEPVWDRQRDGRSRTVMRPSWTAT